MKVPKQISLKAALALWLATLLVCSVLYVWAVTPTSTMWISPGVYPGAPSYTIWPEGSNYFAKTEYGDIEFSGTNASEVINNALTSGQKVYLHSGLYVLDSPIVFGSNAMAKSLEGECNDLAPYSAALIQFSGVGGAIQIGGPTRIQGVQIKNLVIGATGAAQAAASAYGIYGIDLEGVTFDHVTIRDFAVGRGLYIQASASSYSAGIMVRDCFMYNNKIGISLEGASLAHGVNSAYTSGLTIIGVGNDTTDCIAVHIGNYVVGTNVFGGIFESADKAFYIEGLYSYILRPRIENVNYDFYLTAGASANIVSNPLIGGSPSIEWNNSGNANHIVSLEGNFVTVNSGISTGTGAQQAIAHGLGDTPTYVWFSNIEDGANAYQSATADATNIYVTAVSGKDYAWKAEYNP